MSTEIDLGAFPILRLDQIIRIDTSVLEDAQRESKLMIVDMESGNGTPPKLLFYLRRQVDTVKQELSLRAADTRIKTIIGLKTPQANLGKTAVSETERLVSPPSLAPSVPYSVSNLYEVGTLTKPNDIVPEEKPKSVISYVPLPSELRAMQARSNESNKISSSVSPMPEPKREVIDSSVYGQAGLKVTSKKPLKGDHPSTRSEDVNLKQKESANDSTTKQVIAKRRPLSGISNNVNPSQRSVDAVYENFGSQFVVAATEKRLRFFPKKKATQDPDAMKLNDRLERRRAAMKRLTDRQTERENQRQMRRLQRKARDVVRSTSSSAHQVAAGSNTIADIDGIDSESSESVSGGEDKPMVSANIIVVERMQEMLSQQPVVAPVTLKVIEGVSPAKPKSIAKKIGPVSNAPNGSSAVILAGRSAGKPSARAKATTSAVAQQSQQTITGKKTTLNTDSAPMTNNSKNVVGPLELAMPIGSLFRASEPDDAVNSLPVAVATEAIPICPDRSVAYPTIEAVEILENQHVEDDDHIIDAPEAVIAMTDDVAKKNRSALDAFRALKQKKTQAAVENAERKQNTISEIRQLVAADERSSMDGDGDTAVEASEASEMTEDVEQSNVNIDYDILPMLSQAPADILSHTTSRGQEVNNLNLSSHQELPVALPQNAAQDVEALRRCCTTDKITSIDTMFSIRSSVLFSISTDGRYICSMGPDQLPGLRAWSLSPVDEKQTSFSAKWIANMDLYREQISPHAQLEALALQRLGQCRTTSFGVLAMAVELESLLTGSIDCATEDQFLSHWSFGLEFFDSKLAKLSVSEASRLFDVVDVCGNCYAISRKLENLLRTGFPALTKKFSDGLKSGDPRPVSDEGGDIGTREDAIMRTSSAPVLMSTQIEEQPNTRFVRTPESLIFRRCVSGGGEATSSSRNDGDEDIDDDDFIVPVYQLLASEPELQPSLLGNASQSAFLTGTGEEVVAVERENLTQPKHKVKLSEYFPSVGTIFPIAYHESGPKDTEVTARALVECMQLQGQLYDEWLEIMSDYATVFSEDRGLSQDGTDSASATVYGGGSKSLHYRVKSSRTEVYNIVTDVFRNILTDWEELPAGLGLGVSWNLLWTWSKPRINMAHLLVWQRVNHFYDSKQLTRKDLLKKNLQRYTSMAGKASDAFEIMPLTFLLPHEYNQFVKAFNEAEDSRETDHAQNFWIMKPVGLSRGRGISLVRDISALVYSQTSVIQKYVEKPLCLAGYKFDLRLYVLVTSFRPLEAFLYKEGFARLSTQAYSLDPADMANKFIHLTNSSIQKQNADGPSKDNPLAQGGSTGGGDSSAVGGSKMALLGPLGLWARLQSFGLNTDAIWQSISLLITKSLVVVDDKIGHQPCCFELFGYDVLLDSDLRPWLLEVNASPSLARENQLDIRVKNAMIKDTIKLVDPIPYDRGALARVLRRRLSEVERQRTPHSKSDTSWERDLQEILGDSVPRRYGEEPRHYGDYERLCPGTKVYSHTLKLKAKIIKPLEK